MTDQERIILVDEHDRPCGYGRKLDVHLQGLRHRAFSIFIWNAAGELLLQRRAACKYHSAGLWANSCCGHPRVAEDVKAAADRRLNEELGMAAKLYHVGHFSYCTQLPNALIENEFVHLFAGQSDALPLLNPAEVESTKWVRPDELITDVAARPHIYAVWFRLYVANISDIVLSPPASRLTA